MTARRHVSPAPADHTSGRSSTRPWRPAAGSGSCSGCSGRTFTSAPARLLRPAATKTRTGRTIPISSRVCAILEMRRHDPNGDEHPATAHVFGNAIGQRVGSVKSSWRTACRKAGIEDLHFHDLRREAGSRWLDHGVPLHTVRDWLGHTSVAQTSTYLATTAKTSHDAMRRFKERHTALPIPRQAVSAGHRRAMGGPRVRASPR